MLKLRISTCDALLSSGKLYLVESSSDLFVKIRSQSGNDDAVSLTHTELSELIDDGTFDLKYGYFASRQVARRARAGRSLVERLPQKERWRIFWKEIYCVQFLEAEKRQEVSRSEASYTAFRSELHKRVNECLIEHLSKPGRDQGISVAFTWSSPCRGSVFTWVRAWEKSNDPMILVRKSIFNGRNAKGVDSERESIINTHLETYLHPNEIKIPQLHHEVNSDIRARNKIRALSNLPSIPNISESTLRRRVDELDKFEVIAAREGISIAKNKLGAFTGGLDVCAPLMRVEMDEWQIDLMAILVSSGVDFSDQQFRDLEIGRYWVCVALDTATRSILGLKLSSTPTAADAKAVVWMAMRDKVDISNQIGCKGHWSQHGHVFHVAVDNGPAFVNTEFKAAMSDLGIGYSVMPAGVPKLRARVERIFRTLATMLMPYLTGRTFSSSKEKGEYPYRKYAVHTAESIIELLVRFVVDVYHVKSHRGLEYDSPNNAWEKLCNEYGWSPAQNEHILRHSLGIELTRKSGRHGVLICGINFHSESLAHHHNKYGSQELDIRVDSENLGHISVWIDDNWHTLPALMDGASGMSFVQWEQMILELRQKNRNATSINQDMIDQAVARIRDIDDEQRAWRRLGPIGISAADIQRAEQETFWGLNFKPDPNIITSDLVSHDPTATGFLSDQPTTSIDTLHPVSSKHDAAAPNDQPVKNWIFSDDK